jgi:hypothetical protein
MSTHDLIRDVMADEARELPARQAFVQSVARSVLPELDESQLSPAEREELLAERAMWHVIWSATNGHPFEAYRLLVIVGWRAWLRHEWPRLRTLAETIAPEEPPRR